MGFNFNNRFFRMPVPPADPIGGGDPTGPVGPVASIYHAPENSYIDVVSGFGLYSNEYVLDIESGFGTIQYWLDISNGVAETPSKKISTNTYGNWSPYIASSATSWTYDPATGSNPRIRFQRPMNGLGIQKDRVYWNGVLKATYQYITLQKSFAIAKYSTLDISGIPVTTTTLNANSTTTLTTGVLFQLDKGSSRGKEVSSTWTILKTDPAGTFQSQPAIAGVDYAMTTGTLTSDIIKLQFLTNYNFEVRLTVNGHTYASNPYQNFPAQTSTNNSTATFYFQTAVPTVTYEIKIPTITSVLTVPNAVLVGSSPFETYQNQAINVESLLNLSTGYWKKIEGLTITPITKSDTEWRTEINASCDVILEARDKVTNELIFTRTGLGPFSISFAVVSSYNLQFKTTLR